MIKINWKKSPIWANYVAKDFYGNWYWYEKKPYISDLEWIPNSGRCVKVCNEWELIKWENSCIKKP